MITVRESVVNVRLQSAQNIGAVTNEQGYFTLKRPASAMDGTLVCTFVGIQSGHCAHQPAHQHHHRAKRADSKELGEVVITAYGSQRKKQVTAAISTISTKDIESRPVSNMFQALQGTAPNLTLQQNTAELGAAMVLNIRGWVVLPGTALIIIDHVQAGNEGLRNLNPYDVGKHFRFERRRPFRDLRFTGCQRRYLHHHQKREEGR